jgi:hypothetical protein
MTPYIYWNAEGDFKKDPRWCAIGVSYGAQWIVDVRGNVSKRHQDKDYFYLLGKLPQHYPVPVRKHDHE